MPLANRSSANARVAFQRHRLANMGAARIACVSTLAHGFRPHEPEDALQRKTVPFAQREHDPLVRRGGLELKIKGHAEPLAERQAPGAIQPPAERRMNDQLHPPALVEKPLGDDGLLSRHRAENLPAGEEIRDRLLRAAPVEAAFFLQPREE
ncbi:MAG: hypothetical protein KatS3mg082_2044 [Nitrospiraceae bacterium]|nr:MAG: hypothetical protein KatS3mg082_2044 [Nitrospiraceae bacterium]